jgi:hypothetical protein
MSATLAVTRGWRIVAYIVPVMRIFEVACDTAPARTAGSLSE